MGTIKVDTPEAQPHVIPEVEKHEKVASDWKEPVHSFITPGQVNNVPTFKNAPNFFHWKQ